jgi:hypothetical protein
MAKLLFFSEWYAKYEVQNPGHGYSEDEMEELYLDYVQHRNDPSKSGHIRPQSDACPTCGHFPEEE